MANERPGVDVQLDALTDAAAALARAVDLDDAVGEILRLAVESTGGSAGAVFLRNPDRSDLTLGVSVGLDEDGASAFEAEVGEPDHPIATAARDVTAVFGRPAIGAAGLASDVPLVVTHDGSDLALGVLTVRWPDGAALGHQEAQVVRGMADLIATAVDRANLGSLLTERNEWYERMANTDPLTGLANRRAFERVLEMELARAGRQGSDVSLVAFDVDAFDSLNASRGHQSGDDVLRGVAAVLAEGVRLVDTVARFGPDEFIVIAPGSGGIVVARRVLDAVAAGAAGAAAGEFTLSAAVVRFPHDGASAPELIAAAESALRSAASQGPRGLQAEELPTA